MATTYEECGPEIYAMLGELVSEYRDDLAGREVTIKLLFGHGGLRHGGYPALGLCKINSLKDRAEGKADATITLDGDRWPKLSPRRRLALLHHELHHVLPGKGLDAAGRPKLKCRPHDHQLGLFKEILQLYREDSCEWALLDMALQDRDQRTLPGMEAQAEAAEQSRAVREDLRVSDARPDLWRGLKLADVCAAAVADRLWEAGELETVGDVADFLGDGDSLEDLGLEPEDLEHARHHLLRCRAENGGRILEGLPAEWLEPKAAEPEPEPGPPAKRKARRPGPKKAAAARA